MCDCYTVGGPFIDVDPDCPVHGYEAERIRKFESDIVASVEYRVTMLEAKVEDQTTQISFLRDQIQLLMSKNDQHL